MKHTFFPSNRRTAARVKAKLRGEAAEIWLRDNKLTRQNQLEFNAFVKQYEKEHYRK